MNDPFDENFNPEERTPRPQLMMGFGFLPRLIKPYWIQLAILYVKRCPKYFLKPAILLTLSLILPILEFLAFNHAVKSVTEHGVFTTGGDVFMTWAPGVIAMFACAIGALVSLVWGLGALLVALTATCRSFLIIDSEHFGRETPALERAIAMAQEEGVQLFRHRKAYLTKLWLTYSILMLFPTIVMFVSSGVVMMGMPAMGSYTMLPMKIEVPIELMVGAAVALGASVTVLSNYALILMPYSALTDKAAAGTALRGFLLSLKTLPAISIYSVIFFVVSSFLSAPIDLLVIYNPDLVSNLGLQILFISLKALWHVLFFMYVVPISMLIPCEMIRGYTE